MTDWQPIETAPKDGTTIIAARFRRGQFVQAAWWQKEFEAWVTSVRQMVMAAGYTIDGQSHQLHSPNIVEPTHWIPFPDPPAMNK